MEREKLLTPDAAAERLAVKVSTVREWLRTGRLPGVKVGRLWRVRESDLEAFMRGESPTPQTGQKGGMAPALV